jgi:hypothetical protein
MPPSRRLGLSRIAPRCYWRAKSMSDCNEDLNNQADENILTDEVSDEALEAASVAPGGLPTLWYGTYCFACPSRPALGS